MSDKRHLRRMKAAACGRTPDDESCVVLRTRTRELAVPVDSVHARSISMMHDGEAPERPLTHHTLASMLSAFNVGAESVEVHGAQDSGFRAVARLRRGQRMCRTLEVPVGDAIALALQQGCDILVPEAVLRARATKIGSTALGPEHSPIWRPARSGDYTPGLIVTRALELRATRTEVHATRRGVQTTQVTRRGRRADIWLPADRWRDLLLGLCQLAAIDIGFEPGEARPPKARHAGQILIRTSELRMIGNVEIDARLHGGEIVITYRPDS